MATSEVNLATLQDRLTYLQQKLEEYKSRKKALEKENSELGTGYDKVRNAKGKIVVENDNYVQTLKNRASLFSPALRVVHSFSESVQKLLNGTQNQNSISALQDAMSHIKTLIVKNDNEITSLNKKIFSSNVEINKIRAQIISFGG